MALNMEMRNKAKLHRLIMTELARVEASMGREFPEGAYNYGYYRFKRGEAASFEVAALENAINRGELKISFRKIERISFRRMENL